MRKVAIVAVVGALNLIGCTTIGHHQNGDKWYSKHSTAHPDGKPEYKTPLSNGDSKDKVQSKTRGELHYRPVEVIPHSVKKALLSELGGLREKDLAFIAVIDTDGNVRYLRANVKKTNRLAQKVHVKTEKLIRVVTYTGSPVCVSVWYPPEDIMIGGDGYDEVCLEWAEK